MQFIAFRDALCAYREMDLRKLRHAVMLADEGSFAAAARRVNLTQPALSRSIQALETSLGLTLFDRLAGGVQPTSAGKAILAHARTLLSFETGLRREAGLLRGGESGSVHFGIGPMLTPLLGDVLAGVAAGAPQLNIRVEVEAIPRLIDLLDGDEVEFFIADTLQAATIEGFATEALAVLPAGFYARAGHPLASRAKLSDSDLAAYPLAAPNPGSTRQSYGAPHAALIACEDVSALKRVTLAGDAIMLGIGIALEPELSQGAIVTLRHSPTSEGVSRVGVVERAGRTRSPAAQRLIEGFRTAFASTSPS